MSNDAVWADPTPEQLGCRVPTSPANLREAGWEFLGKDEASLEEEGAKIEIWKHSQENKWYLVLRKGRGRGGAIVCSSLAFNSAQLPGVIAGFKTVLEVLV